MVRVKIHRELKVWEDRWRHLMKGVCYFYGSRGDVVQNEHSLLSQLDASSNLGTITFSHWHPELLNSCLGFLICLAGVITSSLQGWWEFWDNVGLLCECQPLVYTGTWEILREWMNRLMGGYTWHLPWHPEHSGHPRTMRLPFPFSLDTSSVTNTLVYIVPCCGDSSKKWRYE